MPKGSETERNWARVLDQYGRKVCVGTTSVCSEAANWKPLGGGGEGAWTECHYLKVNCVYMHPDHDKSFVKDLHMCSVARDYLFPSVPIDVELISLWVDSDTDKSSSTNAFYVYCGEALLHG